MAGEPEFALSIKQPWASLVLCGLKTIEIRKWSTPRRGRIYIHTGKLADERREGWDCLPPTNGEGLVKNRGGVIGSVELVDVVRYTTLAGFRADAALHRNALSWFMPGLYGFRLRDPRIVPFRSLPGNVRFFRVKK
jgi:hypothetical protein